MSAEVVAASAAGTNSTSATSALGQAVPPPPGSTQNLSAPAAPAPAHGTFENGNVVLPALPTIDIASLVMPTEVAAMGEVVGLHDVPIIVPTKIFFETKPGWSIGTRQNPIAAIKRDKANDPNDKYRIIHGPLVPRVDPTEYQKVILHAAVTITGVLIMIPVRVDGDDNWAITLRAGIAASALGWIRLVSNKTAGRYCTGSRSTRRLVSRSGRDEGFAAPAPRSAMAPEGRRRRGLSIARRAGMTMTRRRTAGARLAARPGAPGARVEGFRSRLLLRGGNGNGPAIADAEQATGGG